METLPLKKSSPPRPFSPQSFLGFLCSWAVGGELTVKGGPTELPSRVWVPDIKCLAETPRWKEVHLIILFIILSYYTNLGFPRKISLGSKEFFGKK